MTNGLRFQTRIISLSGKYPREIITYLGGIIPGFIEYSVGISFAKS